MNVLSTVKQAIRTGAIAALDEYPTTPVIFSHSNGTEPAESYLIINILQVTQVGRGYTSTLTNEAFELSIQGNYNVTVQFSFIGSLSMDMSQSFMQRLDNNVLVREALQKNNLNFRTKTNIRRAPQKRETQWVEYHNFDAVFSYVINTQQVVDVVEAIELVDTSTGEVLLIPPDYVPTTPSP